MKSKMCKRAIALACIGVMVTSGSGLGSVIVKAEEAPSLSAIMAEEAPALEAVQTEDSVAEAYAAGEKVLKQEVLNTVAKTDRDGVYSGSGYKRITLTEQNGKADSEERKGEGDANGWAKYAIDGNENTYWHSRWSDNNEQNGDSSQNPKNPNTNDANATANKYTITLPEVSTIKGVTYLPRQAGSDEIGGEQNGTARKIDVRVRKASENEFTTVVENAVTNLARPYEVGKEVEVLFNKPIENVEAVQIVFKDAYVSSCISAAEIGVLSTRTKLEDNVQALREKYEATDYDQSRLYQDAKVEALLKEADEFIKNLSSKTTEEIKNMNTKVEEQLAANMEFTRDRGTGIWLSDIDWKGAHSGWGDAQKDRDIDVSSINPIEVKNEQGTTQNFKKGLSIHAGTNVYMEYEFQDVGQYKMFEALVGQRQTGNKNDETVEVLIKTQEKPEWTSVQTVAILKDESAKWVRVDISQATGMKLVVQDNSKVITHMNWADAKLYTTLTKENGHPELHEAMKAAEGELRRADTDYTDATREQLLAAYANAEAVMEDTTKTLDEVNAAKETLLAKKAELAVKQYTVTVKGQNVTIPGPAGTKAEVVAAVKQGEVFDHWENKAGKVVSTSETYKFVITGDDTLTPVYRKEATESSVQNGATIPSVTVMQRADGRFNLKYLVQLQIPKESTLVETGLLWNNKPEKVSEEQFNLAGVGAGQVKVKKATKVNVNYQYYMMLNGARTGMTIQGRVYATIRNEKGIEETVYSEIIEQPIGKLA